MATASRRPGRARHGSAYLAGRLLIVAWLTLAAVSNQPTFAEPAAEAADEPDASERPYLPGVIVRYRGAEGAELTRLDNTIALTSDSVSSDPPVATAPFQVAFNAHLFVQSPGLHRLRVFAAGRVQMTLAGKMLLDAHAREPAWLDAEAIDLPFGYHALEIRYERAAEAAMLQVFWEGPNFALEPLAARWLFHAAGKTPSDDFEQGRQWVRALRCAACHDVPGTSEPLPAPALDRLAGNLSRGWIVERLAETAVADSGEVGPSRRMPHFALTRSEAQAVADYLLARSEKAPTKSSDAKAASTRSAGKDAKPADPHLPAEKPPEPSAAAGGRLFRSLGCLACHRVSQLGSDGLFGGGDLSTVAAKRPVDFFARWLADPAAINRDHRMPVFALNAFETASLSRYLNTLGDQTAGSAAAQQESLDRGAKLVRDFRCGACHALPGASEKTRPRLPLDITTLEHARDGANCLAAADRAKRRPGYRLGEHARRATIVCLTASAGVKGIPPTDGRDLLVERNCLACHARDRSPGLAEILPAIAAADATLGDSLATLVPPALTGVGDKLIDDALAASITANQPPRQSWLRVRMPRFPLSGDETQKLVRYFVEADRMPDRPGAAEKVPVASAASIEGAGARLVTADGFGCTSCHAIGNWGPQQVAPAAHGADLSQLGKRVRRAWFDRFVSNPARAVPQMEMPAIGQPIRGVLEGQLEAQIAAIWQVLNREGFSPPSPNALRVARRANLPELNESAAVLTDVIEIGPRAFVKPLVIGLPNRHNVLYDLATARLVAWWTGDVARQQTRGKSWYWEAGVPQLLPADEAAAAGGEIVLRSGEKPCEVVVKGQYVTEFDWLEHVAGGVELGHRLRFQLEDRQTQLCVTQSFVSLSVEVPRASSGFRRHVRIERLPSETQAELHVLPPSAEIDHDGRTATLGGRGAALHVRLRLPAAARFSKNARGVVVTLGAAAQQPIACELDYLVDIPVDEFPPRPAIDRSVTRQELSVVPGFEAVRLPVTDEVMPTGLAWRPDGTLVVSSLEGRVWLAHDTDGDRLEDRLVPFSDDLAAPFGLAAPGDAIDVINKYGLLRLVDKNADGRADRIELLASGWGHTLDYHDWAVGLPRDAAGNYYVSLPCQQDDRAEAGATLRGTVVKLAPREPSDDDPRRFAIEQLCGGLRFGQGIALSRDEELFVTDNQGNYTPFNELNHIVKGARYGFINRLESKRGIAPPFLPAAIEIPHPWTRSVNGICFLEVPAETRAQPANALFGPFAGHLVGCEYDTRRLVRMSLQKEGDTWQGAVYPLSREPAVGEETFEGPLVCAVSPTGDLYVGNIRDSGWGGGSNTGSLVRLRRRGDLPAGIGEVRARPGGFTIDFTAPVDRARAADTSSYAVSSYRRIPTPGYGAPDVDRREESIRAVRVADDRRSAAFDIEDLREGFVYEFHLRDRMAGGEFFPAEAYYTLRRAPK